MQSINRLFFSCYFYYSVMYLYKGLNIILRSLIMNDYIYIKLRDYLNMLPGGFPSTDTGIELKILKKLFTEEQAVIFLKLSPMPDSVKNIAAKLNMEEGPAAEKLEVMASNGLVFRMRSKDGEFYSAISFIVGIYEFSLGKMDKELSEMMEEYFPYIGGLWQGLKTKQMRVIPVNSSVESNSAIASYDSIYDLIKDKKLISVSECICTKEKGLIGHKCGRPAERCIQFDHSARFYIDNGLGRQIDQFELMKILKMGEENSLVLSPMNMQNIVNLCLCCGCCCAFLNILKMSGSPAYEINSSYQARIDPDKCTACGECRKRCQMEAIAADKANKAFKVDKTRCIGCGLCVPACPEGAVIMINKDDKVQQVPDNIVDLNIKIAKERGIIK